MHVCATSDTCNMLTELMKIIVLSYLEVLKKKQSGILFVISIHNILINNFLSVRDTDTWTKNSCGDLCEETYFWIPVMFAYLNLVTTTLRPKEFSSRSDQSLPKHIKRFAQGVSRKKKEYEQRILSVAKHQNGNNFIMSCSVLRLRCVGPRRIWRS